MLAIQINFVAGRYHATPWNKQVNEGEVEWPPSPWRFLRALIAVWYQKGQGLVTEETLVGLLEKLSVLPTYWLPPATLTHTRHYMPIGEIDKGVEKTALVLDTFLAISKSTPLILEWKNVELSPHESQGLKVLLEGMGYFGRAESLTQTGILDSMELEKIKENTRYFPANPMTEFSDDNGTEPVKTLVCLGNEGYNLWKKKNADKFKETGFPESFFDALQVQTSHWKSKGWDKPPGSQWAFYARKKGALNGLPEVAPKLSNKKGRPTVARFAVACAVRPNLKHALSLAERVHKSLVKYSGGEPVFTGCDEAGMPLEKHRHASIFCERPDEQSDLRKTISHITVYAPAGFNENAERALRGIKKVWGHGGHDVNLLLLGIGSLEDFTDTELLAKSRRWESLTPFVPTRHPKSTRAGKPKLDAGNGLQIGTPEHDLLRLLKLEGRVPTKITCNPLGIGNRALLGFTLERRTGEGRKAGNRGYSCSLEFDDPVTGPISAGYGSHFGLGAFVPARNKG